MENRGMKKMVSFLQRRLTAVPSIAVVLGSGLGQLVEVLRKPVTIPYASIPGFPLSSVKGHSNALHAGVVEGVRVLLFSGRFHYYEGFSMEEVTLHVRLSHALGIRTLLLTNAAGGINRKFPMPSIMLIRDHINLMGTNPLIGRGKGGFTDMTEAYDPGLAWKMVQSARDEKIQIQQGVYAALTGPAYETPAEIRMLARLGADAVGMSTVPETIMARSLGLRVVALSAITNRAAGLAGKPLDHEDVVASSYILSERLVRLVSTFIRKTFKEGSEGQRR
jgi:purine-nucleoside phosphorylase